MKIQVKLLNGDAKLPVYATSGSAGCDFFATEDFVVPPTTVKPVMSEDAYKVVLEGVTKSVQLLSENTEVEKVAETLTKAILQAISGADYRFNLGTGKVGTGIAVGIPKGSNVELELRSKSGLAFKVNILAFNGTVDEDYILEISVLVFNFSSKEVAFKKGDKVAQGVFKEIVQADFEIVDELNPEVIENKDRENNASVVNAQRLGGQGSTGGVSALETGE